MDPLSTILTALVAGAGASAKEVTIQAVKDGYGALKALLIRKFGRATGVATSIQRVESKPDSVALQSALKDELTRVGADSDLELIQHASMLLELLGGESGSRPSVSSAGLDGSGSLAQGGGMAAAERGVAIGGDAHGSVIITGDGSSVRKT